MGVIFDRLCMLWQKDCDIQGSCMLYDNTGLSLGFLVLCASVAGVSLTAMVVAALCYRAPTTKDSVILRVNGADSDEQSHGTAAPTNPASDA